MAELIRVTDSIAFAREIAQDIELAAIAGERLPSEDEIHDAVDIMNHHLHGMNQNERAILKASEVFTIPTDAFHADMMSEAQIEAARVEDVLVRARLRSFVWFGSIGVRGFGAELYGVDFIDPKLHHTQTAFMPLDAAEARIKEVHRRIA